jgi:hypothetical protein
MAILRNTEILMPTPTLFSAAAGISRYVAMPMR